MNTQATQNLDAQKTTAQSLVDRARAALVEAGQLTPQQARNASGYRLLLAFEELRHRQAQLVRARADLEAAYHPEDLAAMPEDEVLRLHARYETCRSSARAQWRQPLAQPVAAL
jgi:hypothetical protein